LKRVNELVIRISDILNSFSCAALALLVGLVTINVIARALFSSPIEGIYDYSGFLTIIIIGGGLAYCSIQNDHIELSFIVEKMNRKLQDIVMALTRIISFILLSVYTYSLFALATRLLRANEVSVTTKTPMCIFVYITAVCFLVFALTVLIKLFPSTAKESKNGT
jgi:TRAP-type C4-dicarboxylate transport system permease small subunit